MSYDRNRNSNSTNRRYSGGGQRSASGGNNESAAARVGGGGGHRQQQQSGGYQQQRGGGGGGYQQQRQQHQQQQDHGGYHGNGGSNGGGRRLPPGSDMPLRMVVNAKYVGAIIGQGGANIRQITKDSKARCVVDVSRGIRDPTGIVEKVINIYGPADNCSKACLKILELVHRESQNDPANQGKNVEPELKLRAHNNLVGRLIGKGGSTIKKIMEETGCTVFVSNISELNAFNMERTITVRGTMANIGQAEQRISAKLRQCWENDMLNAPPSIYAGGMMNPLMNAAPPSSYAAMDQYGGGGRSAYGQRSAAIPPPPTGIHSQNAYAPPPLAYIPSGGRSASSGGHQMSPNAAMGMHAMPPPPTLAPPPNMLSNAYGGGRQQRGGNGAGGGPPEVAHVWVPHNMVGALIGTKGAQIRNITRLTGAHIRIEAGPAAAAAAAAAKSGGESPPPAAEGSPPIENDRQQQQQQPVNNNVNDAERRVTITGNALQQYKAQFWIFQRVAEQGYRFIDDVRLCTEIMVPSRLVGRIIGKGGQNVRELQRHTGAQVKVPEDAVSSESEQTLVQIIGNFNAAHAVQSRVRQLLGQFAIQQQYHHGAGMAGGDYEPIKS